MLLILKGVQGRVKNVMVYLIHSALALLGVGPRASSVLGMCSTAELCQHPQTPGAFLCPAILSIGI